MPSELCARVVVRDVRSGRRAVLWESGKGQWEGDELPPDSPRAPLLPQDSLLVFPVNTQPIVYPPCGTGEEAVKMTFGFHVRPEAGQEGVPARDKLWRLAGGDAEHYGQHDSFAST
jgi:hypothetical protein